MTALLLIHPLSVFPAWVLWVMTCVAIAAMGIGPLASWLKTTRIARGLLLSLTSAAVFVLIVIDCWGLPDWVCTLLP